MCLVKKFRGRERSAIIALLVVSIMTGCGTAPSHHSIDFSGTIEVENEEFVMNGNISVSVGAESDTTFDKVSIVFYTSEKKVIQRVSIGTLSTRSPLQQPVNFTLSQIPAYVVIESPDFWRTDATVYVEAYERPEDGRRYYSYTRTSAQEKFPTDTTET